MLFGLALHAPYGPRGVRALTRESFLYRGISLIRNGFDKNVKMFINFRTSTRPFFENVLTFKKGRPTVCRMGAPYERGTPAQGYLAHKKHPPP